MGHLISSHVISSHLSPHLISSHLISSLMTNLILTYLLTLTLHSHSLVSLSTLTLHPHSPPSLSTLTLHSHSPLSLSTLTLHSHSPLGGCDTPGAELSSMRAQCEGTRSRCLATGVGGCCVSPSCLAWGPYFVLHGARLIVYVVFLCTMSMHACSRVPACRSPL